MSPDEQQIQFRKIQLMEWALHWGTYYAIVVLGLLVYIAWKA